jgi:hypothetical protein
LIVDQLLSLHKDEDIAIVHFYCDYREQQSQTPEYCARQLLRQLLTQCNSLPHSVSDFYVRTLKEVKDQSWYIELRKMLCRIASTFSACYFVIDALDEAEARSHLPGLLELLNVLRSDITARRPKIFATSRKHATAIQKSFDEAIILNVAAQDEDLRTILAKTIADQPDSEHVLDDTLKEDILVTLCASADGMCVTLLGCGVSPCISVEID